MNVLLDSLLRPDGDVTPSSKGCIRWEHEPQRAIPHVVVGEAQRTGGQWADTPVSASWDIGALSYSEQLSLPGYTIADHWSKTKGEPLPELTRPSRAEVAAYFAAYPEAVGITKFIGASARVEGVSRTSQGFHVASHNLLCKNVVLASGTFDINLPPPRSLMPLSSLSSIEGPVLVVGSGFTAADLIISTPPNRKVIHLFNWSPDEHPSPLKGCHPSAYPEYAGIYRQMKLAAAKAGDLSGVNTNRKTRKPALPSSLQFFSQRDWSTTYEGYPNAKVSVKSLQQGRSEPANAQGESTRGDATVIIAASYLHDAITRDIASFHYVVGRRGSLSYLNHSLLNEVLESRGRTCEHSHERGTSDSDPWGGEGESGSEPSPPLSPLLRAASHHSSKRSLVSSSKLREKIEDDDNASMELAPGVFVVGSLTGDSLVRYAIGGCCVVAGKIMDGFHQRDGACDDSNGSIVAVLDPTEQGQRTDSTLANAEVLSFKAPPISIVSKLDSADYDENKYLDRRRPGLIRPASVTTISAERHDGEITAMGWCAVS